MEIKTQMDGPGYGITEKVLSGDECDNLINALSIDLSKRGRAGARHLMSHPAVAALASDQRLLEMARSSLGGGKAVPYRATLFDKSVHAKWLVVWHQDKALPLETIFDAPGWGRGPVRPVSYMRTLRQMLCHVSLRFGSTWMHRPATTDH
jgi:hypothetical protein